MGKAAISMAIFHESEGNHYESEPRGELDGIAAMVLETVGVKAFSLALETTNLGRGTTPGHGIAKLVRLEVK